MCAGGHRARCARAPAARQGLHAAVQRGAVAQPGAGGACRGLHQPAAGRQGCARHQLCAEDAGGRRRRVQAARHRAGAAGADEPEEERGALLPARVCRRLPRINADQVGARGRGGAGAGLCGAPLWHGLPGQRRRLLRRGSPPPCLSPTRPSPCASQRQVRPGVRDHQAGPAVCVRPGDGHRGVPHPHLGRPHLPGRTRAWPRRLHCHQQVRCQGRLRGCAGLLRACWLRCVALRGTRVALQAAAPRLTAAPACPGRARSIAGVARCCWAR